MAGKGLRPRSSGWTVSDRRHRGRVDELVTGSGAGDPELLAVSMQIGCVRVTERFLTSDPPTPTELKNAEAMVNELLSTVAIDEPRLLDAGRLVGLAGTVSTLAALHAGLDEYDRARLHDSVLTADNVNAWYRTLAAEVREAAWIGPAWWSVAKTSSWVGR